MDTIYGRLSSTPSSSSSSIGLGIGPSGLRQANSTCWVPDGSLRKTTEKMSLVRRLRESLRSNSLEQLGRRSENIYGFNPNGLETDLNSEPRNIGSIYGLSRVDSGRTLDEATMSTATVPLYGKISTSSL